MPSRHDEAKVQAITEIQSLLNDLEVGQDARAVCPYCDGGSTRERSLSVTRSTPHMGKYMCFRASCDLGSGSVMLVTDPSGKTVFYAKSKKATTTQNQYRLVTLPLWKSLARMLFKRYRVEDEYLVYGNVRATRDGRVAFTIFSPKRRRRGYVIRKYKDHYRGQRDYASVPKALNYYINESTIGISWYFKERHKRKQTDTLIVVEDIVSALRVCKFVDCCAILGTVMEPKRQKEIKAQRYKKVVIALDADANRRSAAIKKQTENYLPELQVKFLDKDFKDMSDEEIVNTLGEYL